MSGDVRALDQLRHSNPSIVVAEARGHVQAVSNDELLAKGHVPDVSIAAAFYNTKTGETRTTTKVTKTQRRKHQINSLAIAAAERELDLLERKGKANRTKHETNARYGW